MIDPDTVCIYTVCTGIFWSAGLKRLNVRKVTDSKYNNVGYQIDGLVENCTNGTDLIGSLLLTQNDQYCYNPVVMPPPIRRIAEGH